MTNRGKSEKQIGNSLRSPRRVSGPAQNCTSFLEPGSASLRRIFGNSLRSTRGGLSNLYVVWPARSRIGHRAKRKVWRVAGNSLRSTGGWGRISTLYVAPGGRLSTERRTTNDERRTTEERRTKIDERRTTNEERRTKNEEQGTGNKEQGTLASGAAPAAV